MKKIANVEKISAPSIEYFQKNYADLDKPVILQGFVGDFLPNYKEWNLDYLNAKLGDKVIGFKDCGRSLHPNLAEPEKTIIRQAPFSEYVKLIADKNRADRSHYFLSGDENNFLCYGKLNPNLDSLRKDFTIPKYIPEEELTKIGLWVTAKGVKTWLHYDTKGGHNLNAQITGSKLFRLFHPNQGQYLSMYKAADITPYNLSQIDFTNFTYEEYPAARHAEYYEADVQAGEVLFIPTYWFHSLEHTGDINININFWWEPVEFKHSVVSSRGILIEKFWQSNGFPRYVPPAEAKKFFAENPEAQKFLRQLEEEFLKNEKID